MSNKSKEWSAGVLKSRGWTEKLMAELLPRPQFRYYSGRRVRVWPIEIVKKVERTDEFQAGKTILPQTPAGNDADAEAALKTAMALLAESWQRSELAGDERTQKLAQRFHDGLMQQITTVSWAERLKPGQCISYIDHFLHLATGNACEPLTGTLRRLITASVWIGRNADAPAVLRLREGYGTVLQTVAAQELTQFTTAQPEADVDGLLRDGSFPPSELMQHPLPYLYSVFYIPRAIRSSLRTLVALHPKDEYPEARAMERHFVIHIGGTNTGKTYSGFQRLIRARTGVYLSPLRLLALEAQEMLLDNGVACSLTTGEEEDRHDGDTHVAATAEKLDISAHYDVAVIDECQMIADAERGFAWSRAILGVLAPEIHLCAAPEAETLLIRVIESTGDSYEVVQHFRKTPLIALDRPVSFERVMPGDALITFSKIGVLSVAEELRRRGKEPAIIYGALPYSTRRKQMEGFLNGDMQYVVSTDAIGMGLNLPIRRVIFLDTTKFDGRERRELRPEEIRQIAGRAGRFGIYDKGFVGATENPELICASLDAVVPPIEHAVVGFSELVLQVDFDLLEVLTEWSKMSTGAPFVKMDVSRYIALITKIRSTGFSLTKEQELRCANIPFDETDEELLELFFSFLRAVIDGRPILQPELPERQSSYTLPELEQYCRMLDLFFSFSKAFDCPIDRELLYDRREDIAESINQILLHNLRNNIRFCAKCGAALPLYQSGRLCAKCYARGRSFSGGAGTRRRR